MYEVGYAHAKKKEVIVLNTGPDTHSMSLTIGGLAIGSMTCHGRAKS
jgi:hypothetical protein